ncbi:MAG TPA: type II secretion system F family protein, partial [Alicyclobacillus sp.]|nr:type II secretion system F family protein [Alicyclobacillus sp.]
EVRSPAGTERAAEGDRPALFGLRLGEGRVKVQALAVFCRQFATLVRAGVPAARSVEILAAQSESRTLKRTLEAVAEEVRQGTALRQAFADHQAVFPPLFINMVGAGEFSGQLDLMLERAAQFYERERATSQKIMSAMTYPTVVLVIALGVSVFLLTSVIPTFAQTFAQQGVALPLPTRITLGLSRFLTERWYLALALVAAVVGGGIAGARTPAGRRWLGRISLAVPVFGRLNRKHAVAQFSRTFATLVRAAVPILDALDLAKKVIGNVLYQEALTEAQEGLRSGRTVAEVLGRYPRLFPPMVVQMIAVGEETGTLDDLLDKLADFYETDVQEMAARLGALLEPMMILFLAVIVGLIILSVYLPMFQMMNFVGS